MGELMLCKQSQNLVKDCPNEYEIKATLGKFVIGTMKFDNLMRTV